jgi:heat shock protein HslJ
MSLRLEVRDTGGMSASRVAIRALSLGLLLVGAVACGDDTESGNTVAEVADPSGNTYVLAEAAGVDIPDGTEFQLAFTDTEMSGSGVCNTMSGPFSVDNSKLVAPNLAVTQIGCAEELMAFDDTVAEFLSSSPGIVVVSDVMTLQTSDITMTFREALPVVDSALEGTTWTVTGTVQGDVTQSLDTEPATMVLNDGTAEVFAGCNTGSAPYTVDGTTIEFGQLVLTRMACEDVAMQLEATVTEMLQGTVEYDIEGTKLTIFQGTDGLTFTSN